MRVVEEKYERGGKEPPVLFQAKSFSPACPPSRYSTLFSIRVFSRAMRMYVPFFAWRK